MVLCNEDQVIRQVINYYFDVDFDSSNFRQFVGTLRSGYGSIYRLCGRVFGIV